MRAWLLENLFGYTDVDSLATFRLMAMTGDDIGSVRN
jgi:hypothetical protein